jgi:hypothetical protein
MGFLELLAQEIERTGHVVNRNGSSLLIEPINLKIESNINERNEHNVNGQYSVVLSITIKATHEQMFPDGIWDCLAGVGGNDHDAFVHASQVWTACNFQPIHEILVPTETAGFDVERLDLVWRNENSGEVFAWKLYLGVLHAVGDIWKSQDSFENNILVKQMFDVIVAELYERKLIWVKTYICKMPDGTIHGDCWLNNKDWFKGLNALYWFAETWQKVETYTALKQFMLIKPCEWSELNNAEEIKQSLPKQQKKTLFRRWFGK